jgi:hypothetical protein
MLPCRGGMAPAKAGGDAPAPRGAKQRRPPGVRERAGEGWEANGRPPHPLAPSPSTADGEGDTGQDSICLRGVVPSSGGAPERGGLWLEGLFVACSLPVPCLFPGLWRCLFVWHAAAGYSRSRYLAGAWVRWASTRYCVRSADKLEALVSFYVGQVLGKLAAARAALLRMLVDNCQM